MRNWLMAAALLGMAWPSLAIAGGQPRAVADTPVRDLAPVVVTGVQPGPGLWKVHGPRGQTLWVLGTVSLLPGGLQWNATEVEQVIARAGVVLGPPSLAVNADVGFFSGMALLPAALRARRNPGGARLEDVLSGGQFARWTRLKDQYLGWEWGIERWRPMFAAEKLFHAALKRHRLEREIVDAAVSRAAKAAGRDITPVVLQLKVEDPRALLKELNSADLGDTACLDRTMTVIEQRMPVLVARANAWATGDIGILRQLPGQDAESDCLKALLRTDFVHGQELGDIPGRVRDTWIAAAEEALNENDTAFAVLGMDQVLDPDGYLSQLAALGYRVEPPTEAKSSTASASMQEQ